MVCFLRGPLLFVLGLIFLSACATSYENTALKSWDLMRDGRADEALKIYEKDVSDSKEALLRLMDEGILLRAARRFEESNQKFFAAAKIIEMNGYLSLGEQTLTLFTNEKQSTYQGEDFEKVLVHLYLGMNFLELKQTDEALVESRRVNEILYKMISEAHRPYELNAFARYMGALLFEVEGDDNDAYVALKNTLKIDPSLAKRFEPLTVDLMRLAKRMGFLEDFDAYKKEFGSELAERAVKLVEQKSGSVVLLFESGKSPRKYSTKERRSTMNRGGTSEDVLLPVAYYQLRHYQVHAVRLKINDEVAKSAVLNDVEMTAVRHLQDRMGRAMAKALASAAAKVGVATAVGVASKSKDLGILVGLGLLLASEADTRSWLLLPAKLQIAKIYLRPGVYDAALEYLDDHDQVIRTEEVKGVKVQAQRPTLIQKRVFD